MIDITITILYIATVIAVSIMYRKALKAKQGIIEEQKKYIEFLEEYEKLNSNPKKIKKDLEELAEYKAEEKSMSEEFCKLGAMTVKGMSEGLEEP